MSNYPLENDPQSEQPEQVVQSAEVNNSVPLDEYHVSLEPIRPPLGVIQRLKLGKAAVTFAAVEAISGVIAVSENTPAPLAYGAFIGAGLVGAAAYGAHQHHVNGYPRENQPMSFLIKRRQWPTRMG